MFNMCTALMRPSLFQSKLAGRLLEGCCKNDQKRTIEKTHPEEEKEYQGLRSQQSSAAAAACFEDIGCA